MRSDKIDNTINLAMDKLGSSPILETNEEQSEYNSNNMTINSIKSNNSYLTSFIGEQN